MTLPTSPKPFAEAALRAFPWSCRVIAEGALNTLAPFVDDDYRRGSIPLEVQGQQILVPKRLHFVAVQQLNEVAAGAMPAVQCLLSRSTDGHIRQAALKRLRQVADPWAVPFIVLSAGQYVIEIVKDLQEALPGLDRPVYANFCSRESSNVARVAFSGDQLLEPLLPSQPPSPLSWVDRSQSLRSMG